MFLSAEIWQAGQSNSPEALEYLNLLHHTVQYRELFHRLLDIKPGMTILDAGCGTGQQTLQIAQANPDIRIDGVDISPIAISTANQNLSPELTHQIGYLQANLESLVNIESNRYDLVYTNRVLQHTLNPFAALSELTRVLKPGGKIALAEPYWLSLSYPDQPELTQQFQQVIASGSYLHHPYLAIALKDILLNSFNFSQTELIPKTDELTGGQLISQIFNFKLVEQLSSSLTLPAEFLNQLNNFATNDQAKSLITMCLITGIKPDEN